MGSSGPDANPAFPAQADIVVVVSGSATPMAITSGDRDLDDLLAVLAAWGPCACPADQDGDGVVDERDLMIVLGAWDVTGGS